MRGAEYWREYYAAHRETRKAQQRKYNSTHKEVVSVRRRKCYSADRDKIIAKQTARYVGRIASGDVSGVYVLSHPSHHMLKVGSATDFKTRLHSFNTGCPNRAYTMPVKVPARDPRAAEKKAHEILTVYRIKGGGEWFNCTLEVAKTAVVQAVGGS